jgi:hypothetical protein
MNFRNQKKNGFDVFSENSKTEIFPFS